MTASEPNPDPQVFVVTPHDYKFVLLVGHDGKVTYCAEKGRELLGVIRKGPHDWSVSTMSGEIQWE